MLGLSDVRAARSIDVRAAILMTITLQ